MKKITNKQARIIAKELINFINKHVAPWDIDEKPTIKGTMEDIRNDPQSIIDWLNESKEYGEINGDLVKDADRVLVMMR